MSETLEFVVSVAAIGIGATAIMDLWAVFLKRYMEIPALNYGMVGRWIGHSLRGRVMHDDIAKADAVRGELLIGWSAHYATGVIFAALLLTLWGLDWVRHPSLMPALIVGVLTLAFPFFIMQPGMGAGIAASKTPNPFQARSRSLMAHMSFGIGLYVAALLLALLT